MKSVVRKSLLFAALLALPIVVLAQTGDPTLDWIASKVPPKYLPLFFGGWALLFYVVGPLVKRYITVKPDSGAAAKAIVKGAEFITQDSHRPPPVPTLSVVASPPAPADPPKGFVTAILVTCIAIGATLALLFVAFAPRPAHAQEAAKLGILSLDLGKWDTHANIGFSGIQVDLKTGAASYEAVSGLYALCYKPWKDACAAGGGGFTLQAGKVTGAVKGGLLSPEFLNPFQVGPGSGGFRLAVTYGHDFATKGDTANAGLVFTF